jgi:hypothetical protein
MCVLDGLTDLHKQRQPLLGSEVFFVTVLRNRDSLGRPKMMPAIWAL